MQVNSGIGGQAVMDGIMMRAGDSYAVAVRCENGETVVKKEVYKSILPASFAKIPVLRGVSAFVDSLVLGTKTLMWSAEATGAFDDEDSQSDKNVSVDDTENAEASSKKEPEEHKGMMALTVIFSILFTFGIFIVLPFLLSSLLGKTGMPQTAISVAEAFIRVGILLLYFYLISKVPDIQKVFAYHGAEHKCINCIETNKPLTPDNVLASSREHKRCGTSFLLVVVMISVIVFLLLGLLGLKTFWARLLVRLLLIPVIAGVSYEWLRLMAVSDSKAVSVLTKPGLMLQHFVTREPDREMTEVAIRAVEEVFDWREWQEKTFGAKDTEA